MYYIFILQLFDIVNLHNFSFFKILVDLKII